MTTTDPVLVSVRNHTGVLELNRPKALNSLNPDMIDIIRRSLEAWAQDDDIEQVLIHSNSPKAFCAGGDVRHAREGIAEGKLEEVDAFFASEYLTNGDIAEFPKPYIAVIDGVVMGGGLGISLHGSHRVVTEKAFASMPEMNIGYVTDVGVAYAAQRMVGTRGVASPGLAKFWGLSGYRMYAADMLWTGVATHVVKDAAELIEAAIERGIDAALEELALPAPQQPAPLEQVAQDLEETFALPTWEEISAELDKRPQIAGEVRRLMAAACPAAIIAANELYEAEAAVDDIREALLLELKLGMHMYRRPDFSEGVRAVLVDKTQDAAFNPATTEDVDVEEFRAVLSS